jgi:hypothetical protein
MPPHLIHDVPPIKRKKRKPNNWHPWLHELEKRNRLRRMKLIAESLGVNAVLPSDDDEDIDLDY